MPYRQPLVPFEVHVADPVDLPTRQRGDEVPSRVVRAEPLSIDPSGIRLHALTSDGTVLCATVQPAGEGIIRVRLAPSFDTEMRAAQVVTMVRPGRCDATEVHSEQGRIRLRAGGLVAEISLDPWHLAFFDGDGRPLVAQNGDASDISRRLRVLPFGRSLVSGSVAAYHETFDAAPDEHFFGLGEKFTNFDKRGQRITSWNYDAFGTESERSYKNVPFYVSTRNYGILVNSGAATEFDLCHSTHSCVQITVPDDVLDYFVIAGETPRQILNRYYDLTGYPQVPPKWALGTWISSGYFEGDQAQVLEMAHSIRDHGVPCDVLHLDAYWQVPQLWSDLRWDASRFPDPDRMLSELADMGFKTSLWMNPYISTHSPVFTEAGARGFLLTRTDGRVYAADSWHGAQPPCGIIDLTNAEAVTWFQDQLRDLLERGVTVFKTDFGEGVPVDAVAANGMSGLDLHNVYSLLFNDVVAEVTRAVHGHGVVWARSSFTGGQRHCAQWAGDNNTTFAAMASTLRGGLSYALSGMPFWSHDVGGFTGEPTPDLFVRSAQFGAFSPFLRFHGTSTRLPWDFDEAVTQAVIEALSLRYQLIPYLYSATVEACRSGLPIMRPLVLDSPTDPATWTADLEYLLGPDLLVGPVVDPTGRKLVYLPRGTWVDYWTGAVHDGPCHLEVAAPLSRMPLFARDGAVIPVQDVRHTVGTGPFRDLTVWCWGRRPGRAVVHDEDGTSTEIVVRYDGDRAEITTEGPVTVRKVTFAAVDGCAAPASVTINQLPARLSTVDGTSSATLD